jgi:hypothetical protein
MTEEEKKRCRNRNIAIGLLLLVLVLVGGYLGYKHMHSGAPAGAKAGATSENAFRFEFF